MLFVLARGGAVLTAFYMFRMWFLVFAGEPRGFPTPAERSTPKPTTRSMRWTTATRHGHDDGHDRNPAAHAHESDWIMVGPLVALAVFSIIVGWGVWFYARSLTPVRRRPSWSRCSTTASRTGRSIRGAAHCTSMRWRLAADHAGRASAWGCSITPRRASRTSSRRRLKAERTAERFGGIYRFLVHKWYFDELYGAVLVRPCLAFARLCRQIDQVLIDGLVNGSAAFTIFVSRLEGIFDMIAVDRLVNLTARAVYVVGDRSRSIQTGRLRNYLMFLTVGLVGLFVGVFAWIRG